jgi:hypothetical protein
VQPESLPPTPNATPEQVVKDIFAAMARSKVDHKTAVDLLATTKNARLVVSDGQDFEALVGNTELETSRTGTTSRTSAASLLLFGSDKHVLWRAP